MTKYLDIMDGAIDTGEQETDFLIQGEVALPPLFKQDDERYEYHQGSTPHCTLYSPMGAISDLFNHKLTDQNIDDIIQLSVLRGKALNKGWYSQAGVKCVCDRWNNVFPDDKVIYYRMEIDSNNFRDAMEKGYTVCVTYKGNGDYGRDIYDNAVLDGNSFPNPTYGHATTSIYIDGEYIKDSYPGRTGKGGIPTNTYKLKDLKGLVDNGVFYPACYLILPEQTKTKEDLERLKEMELLISTNMENNSKLRFMSNDTSYKDWLHECNDRCRDKLEDIRNEYKKL